MAPPLAVSSPHVRRFLLILAACSSSPKATPPVTPPPPAGEGLKPVEAFASIGDRSARSRALFGEVARVLTSARCSNCHPPDDVPRQGDHHVLHDPPIIRGTANNGVDGLHCGTCHQDRNAELARIPGAPAWQLAPLQMAWLDRTPSQICAQLSDPKRNGGRSLAQVHDHLAHDKLVAWGWAPGANRIPAPGSQAQVAALFQAWIDSGAVCP